MARSTPLAATLQADVGFLADRTIGRAYGTVYRLLRHVRRE